MNTSPSSNVQKINLSIDFRLVTIVLLVIVVAMLLVWKPWQAKTSDRTVEVTGQTTLRATPDEFVFYPAYEFENADKQAALDALTAKSNEVVAGLKKLGVADKGIKTNSSSWSYPIYLNGTDEAPTYTLQVIVTVNSESLTQKVQDYLLTTEPSGAISPQAAFSEKKRKELEDKARIDASKDARAKAEQSAENLGFKIAAVKTVNDGANFGGTYYATDKATTLEADASGSSLAVQAGENELTYSVTVVYYIR